MRGHPARGAATGRRRNGTETTASASRAAVSPHLAAQMVVTRTREPPRPARHWRLAPALRRERAARSGAETILLAAAHGLLATVGASFRKSQMLGPPGRSSQVTERGGAERGSPRGSCKVAVLPPSGPACGRFPDPLMTAPWSRAMPDHIRAITGDQAIGCTPTWTWS